MSRSTRILQKFDVFSLTFCSIRPLGTNPQALTDSFFFHHTDAFLKARVIIVGSFAMKVSSDRQQKSYNLLEVLPVEFCQVRVCHGA